MRLNPFRAFTFDGRVDRYHDSLRAGDVAKTAELIDAAFERIASSQDLLNEYGPILPGPGNPRVHSSAMTNYSIGYGNVFAAHLERNGRHHLVFNCYASNPAQDGTCAIGFHLADREPAADPAERAVLTDLRLLSCTERLLADRDAVSYLLGWAEGRSRALDAFPQPTDRLLSHAASAAKLADVILGGRVPARGPSVQELGDYGMWLPIGLAPFKDRATDAMNRLRDLTGVSRGGLEDLFTYQEAMEAAVSRLVASLPGQ